MNFRDIPADVLNIRVKQTDNASARLQEQPVLSVHASLTRHDEFEIRLKRSVVLVKPVVNNDIRRLNSELASGRAILAQLANPAVDGSIELQIAFFAGELLEMVRSMSASMGMWKRGWLKSTGTRAIAFMPEWRSFAAYTTVESSFSS